MMSLEIKKWSYKASAWVEISPTKCWKTPYCLKKILIPRGYLHFNVFTSIKFLRRGLTLRKRCPCLQTLFLATPRLHLLMHEQVSEQVQRSRSPRASVLWSARLPRYERSCLRARAFLSLLFSLAPSSCLSAAVSSTLSRPPYAN